MGLLSGHKRSDDLVVRSTGPKSLQVTHDILVNLIRRVDGSLNLVQARWRDSLSAWDRSRRSGDKEWVREDLGHLP